VAVNIFNGISQPLHSTFVRVNSRNEARHRMPARWSVKGEAVLEDTAFHLGVLR
jgi:hypothetical protein